MPKKTPSTLMPNARRWAARSQAGPPSLTLVVDTPALRKATSRPPNAVTAAATAASSAADGGRHLRAPLVAVGHHDPGAVGGQPPGRRGADAVGAAGDQGHGSGPKTW